jgi:hypothetical protein
MGRLPDPIERSGGWWSDIDGAVLHCLAECGPTSPVELAHRVGMSESAVTSLLCLLAAEGRVRISVVEAPAGAGEYPRQRTG